jgi:hypothetical protein
MSPRWRTVSALFEDSYADRPGELGNGLGTLALKQPRARSPASWSSGLRPSTPPPLDAWKAARANDLPPPFEGRPTPGGEPLKSAHDIALAVDSARTVRLANDAATRQRRGLAAPATMRASPTRSVRRSSGDRDGQDELEPQARAAPRRGAPSARRWRPPSLTSPSWRAP